MMVFLRTAEFDEWLRALRDPIGKARILARLRAAELGHFGDHAPVGDAVYELRIHTGPGYRVYYWRQGSVTYWLLCGGDKSTQPRDIRQAKALRTQLEEDR
jgi:putative addiction module killer protein